MFVTVLLGTALSGCAGNRRKPAIGSNPDQSTQPALSTPSVTLIRVLLLEEFGSCRIDGSSEGSGLLIEEGQGEVRLFREHTNELTVLKRSSGFRLKPARANFIRVNGRAYRGDVEAFVNPVGRAVVVNELPIEDYLRGVVPLELGPTQFPYLEALSAQAVAARTFAVSHLGTWASRGFDLYGDARSQVYGGISAEDARSDEAIRKTRGTVSIYRGNPIVALYSSTCGGVTEAFDLIFRGAPIDYLEGGVICHDQDSEHYSWEQMINLDEIQESLQQHAGVGRLKRLSPIAFGKSERIVEMEFVGSDGTRILKGNDIRFALGVRSNLFTVLETISESDGFIRQLTVQGRGWGHGVGLCQMGAVNLAQEGRTHAEILRHYYPGTTLAEWY